MTEEPTAEELAEAAAPDSERLVGMAVEVLREYLSTSPSGRQRRGAIREWRRVVGERPRSRTQPSDWAMEWAADRLGVVRRVSEKGESWRLPAARVKAEPDPTRMRARVRREGQPSRQPETRPKPGPRPRPARRPRPDQPRGKLISRRVLW
jgi:hypothetical protein